MLESRMCRMFGAAIRVPAKWEDLKSYVNLRGGEVLRARGFPEGRTGNARTLLLQMFTQDAPQSGGFGQVTMDFSVAVKDLVKRQGQELLETGPAKDLPKGKEGAWAVSTRTVQGTKLKCHWTILQHNGKLLTMLFTAAPEILDANRETIEEMYKSAAWEGRKKKAG